MSRYHHYIIFPINKVLSAELSELKMYKPHPNEKLNKKTRPLSSKSLKKDSERETHEPPLRKKKGGGAYMRPKPTTMTVIHLLGIASNSLPRAKNRTYSDTVINSNSEADWSKNIF